MVQQQAATGRERASKDLLWIGVVNLLVGIKLGLSFVVPGLRSPGELLLSGGLLLITAVAVFRLRSGLVRGAGSAAPARQRTG